MTKPGTFEYIEQKIRRETDFTSFGRDFEWLCKYFVENAPQYKGMFKKVWFWKDWPKRPDKDKGIDLVAELKNGELWAIQSKAWSPSFSIRKSDIDSFLSDSNRPQFSHRLLISTTDHIGDNAWETIKGQQIPVSTILRSDLLSTQLTWPVEIGSRPTPGKKKKPRQHQQTAISNILKGFKNHDRGQFISACGTGKTLTSLWVAERMKAKRVLYLVPSLSLLSQTINEWRANCQILFNYLVVCSDETVDDEQDRAIETVDRLGIPVTTDPNEIKRFLRILHSVPSVVFGTYQSSDRIAAAQKSISKPFDIVFADEAHNCASTGVFGTVIDPKKIKARYRLFQTATPKFVTNRLKTVAKEKDFEVASMDDEKLFGPVFHTLTFGEAIKKGLLSDYQVSIMVVSQAETKKYATEGTFVRFEKNDLTDARTLATEIGLVKAIKKYRLEKILSFHGRVSKARRFASEDEHSTNSFPAVASKMGLSSLWSDYVSGEMPAGKRTQLLNNLREHDGVALLANCSCLGEGVDVPAIDGVAFIDPKRSVISIVQPVGRAIRKSKDKKIGTIVLPVFIDEDEDEETALSESAFEPVWTVLKALQAHDEVLREELNEYRKGLGKLGKVKLPRKIKIGIPTTLSCRFSDFVRKIEVRIVKGTTENWYERCGEMHKFLKEMGKFPNKRSKDPRETSLGIWFGRQLQAYTTKAIWLTPERVSKLRPLFDLWEQKKRKPIDLEKVQQMIIDWFKKYGEFPTSSSGQIKGIRNLTGHISWASLGATLNTGYRDLSPTTLPEQINVCRQILGMPMKLVGDLRLEHIQQMIIDWYKKNGKFPTAPSGEIKGITNLTRFNSWASINNALRKEQRGLRKSTLTEQVDVCRRKLSIKKIELKEATIQQMIIDWYKKSGKFPIQVSGKIVGIKNPTTCKTWGGIQQALWKGRWGLPKGGSLSQQVVICRRTLGISNPDRWRLKADVDIKVIHQMIIDWFKKYGRFPTDADNIGRIKNLYRFKSWGTIDMAFRNGNRGLPTSSLPTQVAICRKKLDIPMKHQSVDIKDIKQTVINWYKEYNKFPHSSAGEIKGINNPSGFKTWGAVQTALREGYRGLPKSSLYEQVAICKRKIGWTKGLPSI